MKINYLDFDEIIKELFNSSGITNYKNIANWTSMQSLIVVSAIDEHFDILLSHQELKKANSLQELYDIISNKSTS